MKTRRDKAMKKATLFCVAVVAMLCWAINAMGQDRTSPDRGFKPAGSYALSEIETINLLNGNLYLNIPLASLPSGRAGLSSKVSLLYNSKLWDPLCSGQTTDSQGQPVNLTGLINSQQGGWRYGISYSLKLDQKPSGFGCGPDCDSDFSTNQWKLSLVFPDGSEHVMHPQGQTFFDDGYYGIDPSGAVYNRCDITHYVTNTLTYYSVDGTYLRLDIEHDSDANWSNNAWTLYFPDGMRVTGNQGPQRIYDRNNNYIEIQNVTYNSHPATKIVDQLGRSIIVEYDSASNRDYIHASGVNNEALTWTISWRNIRVNKAYRPVDAAGIQWSGTFILDQTLRVIDQIILPAQAGSLTYTFDYNATAVNPYPSNGWGEMKSITLPTGAQASYTYTSDGLTGSAILWKEVTENKPTTKQLAYLREFDGTTVQETESWQYSSPAGGGLQITAPDGGTTTSYTSFGQEGLIGKIDQPGSITERIWQENLPFGAGPGGLSQLKNPYVKTEFKSVKVSGTPTQTAITDYTYDKNGNVTRMVQYDWVSYSSVPRNSFGEATGIPAATPKRITVSTYYSPTPDASNTTTDDPDAYHKPTSPHLRNAIESSEIRDQNDQAVSRTEFFYDDSTTTGNLIQQKSWDSTKGSISRPLSSSNSISASLQYDQYGNLTLTTDARGFQTQLVYGPINGFSGLYVTQSTTALNTSMARTASNTYDFYTGQIVSQTDIDNNVTTRKTYDALGRPTLVQEAYLMPVERRTSMEYSDALRRVIIRSDLNTTGDGKLVSIQHHDQLGRLRLSRQLEDAAAQSAYDETTGIKAQTRYKYSGGNFYVIKSNPYRAATSGAATTETTMGWARTKLDKAGRVIEAQTFSGATLPSPLGSNTSSTGTTVTVYDANQTTATDQASKKRRTIADALGRLNQVDEFNDNGSVYASTFYLYDVRSNLIKVAQGNQQRFFMYDSLNRLIRARNPEQDVNAALGLNDPLTGNSQWSLGYSYDNNGNLTQSTDTRGIIANYGYDALNRVTSRAYLNDPQATPQVNYFYDNQSLPAGAPSFSRGAAIGRLVGVTYGGGSAGSYQGYDSIGQVAVSYQVTDSVSYQMSYGYDLAGNLTSQVYPSGKEYRTSFDNIGRISSVSRYINQASDKTYASQFQYTPHGGISQMTLGNSTRETMEYNSRLQPTLIELRKTADNSLLLGLDYTYGTTTNNGNVQTQTIRIGTTTNISQSYGYDSLNRLTSAQEAVSGLTKWTQTYGYDRFGNRTSLINSGSEGGLLPTQSTPSIDAATNRLVGFVYDTAGNVKTDNAGNQFDYDAENRQVKYNNGAASYVYDGDGRRVKKTVGTETTIFVYNAAGQLIAEYGQPQGAGGTSYLTTDHLGSTRVVTDASGSVKARHDYLPFGEEIAAGLGTRTQQLGYSPQADKLRQKFTSKERDIESGLDYFIARYYSSTQSRFTSVDPFMGSARGTIPQSWNRYSYVLNNPLVLVDPNGLDWYRKDGVNYWFEGSDAREGYEHLNIGPEGLRINNVQGATGQYAQYNGHNITLYNEGAIVDHGLYVPPPPPELPDHSDEIGIALAWFLFCPVCVVNEGVTELDRRSRIPGVQGEPINVGVSFGPHGMFGIVVIGKGGPSASREVVVNLGGEGEVPGTINQNTNWIIDPDFQASRNGATLQELKAEGHQFVVSENGNLPFLDRSVDRVITNGVPIGRSTSLQGPGIQAAEVWRILKDNGTWVNNGTAVPRP